VQVLPWDFRFSFPEPLEEAIIAGKLHEEDAEPENVKSLHDEHARHALVILSDLDAVMDARRRGVDPRTGNAPRTDKQRERLEVLFREEPGRLEHAFGVLMDVYEEAFGPEATDAFRKAIRAWHAGIEVLADHPPCVPPFPESVRDGVFGVEDDGTPVRLSVEEIETITDRVAEKLLGSADEETKDRVLRQYAQDFGQAAADRLAAWTDTKVRAEEAKEFSYDPGHPWHYYYKGDNANPIPLDEIPASDEHGFAEATKLPKDPKLRDAKLRQTLFDQERQLKENEHRYTDLMENGVDALNDYDRNIAHGGDDGLAWASAIALSYNHIRHGRGRVQWLRQKLA
jgi:plasmid stabilization system protein ParE